MKLHNSRANKLTLHTKGLTRVGLWKYSTTA